MPPQFSIEELRNFDCHHAPEYAEMVQRIKRNLGNPREGFGWINIFVLAFGLLLFVSGVFALFSSKDALSGLFFCGLGSYYIYSTFRYGNQYDKKYWSTYGERLADELKKANKVPSSVQGRNKERFNSIDRTKRPNSLTLPKIPSKPILPAPYLIRKQIELIAVKAVRAYEKNQGRCPEDVSSQNLGYDIVSNGENEERLIEVKAFATVAQIAVTANEYRHLTQNPKAYLYVVQNCNSNQLELLIFNNLEALQFEEKIVKYEVHFSDLTQRMESQCLLS